MKEQAADKRTYLETFDDGTGGWSGYISNAAGPKPLEHTGSVVTSRSPFWIDYNHAPPERATSTWSSS